MNAPDTSIANVLKIVGDLHDTARHVTHEPSRSTLLDAAALILALLQERRASE